MPNRWLDCRAIPPGPRAALAALHLTEPSLDALGRLSAADWRAALDYCDRMRLSLVLGVVAGDALPPKAREDIAQRSAKHAVRRQQFEALYRELHDALAAEAFEFVALKGLAHDETPGRVQYDIDLYLPPETVHAANDALIRAGWTPLADMESFPTDHLPALLRRTDWKWRGDYFDRGLPIAVELHFQFWQGETERIAATGSEEFWGRRVPRQIAGVAFDVLAPVDALAFASLHLLRHVFRGSVYIFHVYELARMLAAREHDEAFWREWRATHSPELQRLQSVAFRLAREWFGSPAIAEDLLPAAAAAWFDQFALSPATQLFKPNKDHLWLQLALIDSPAERWKVARRRMLPGNLPPRAGKERAGERAYFAYTLARFRHHAVALPRTAVSGLRFWWRLPGLGADFRRFVVSAALFNFGLFIFFLHYNLFLLDLGFHEDFIGTVNSAMRVGSMAGTLPAAWAAERLGLRRALLATLAATVAAEVFRALVGARMPLAVLAFLSGAAFSVWAVILAPVIAGAVRESQRARAFSTFFACMIATGVAGNWTGGLLPALIPSRRTLLVGSAALSALALLPALRLAELPVKRAAGRLYPRSRFLLLYLIPFAVWHFATGAFNPFNNVYFKNLGFSDRRLGSLFAESQLLQIVTLLAAPLVIRRLGVARGAAATMLVAAAALAGLAAQPSTAAAVAAYLAYMSFQWMSEPGLNTLLMNGVGEHERSGASSLTYLVAFGAQAAAAFWAGSLFTRFGYGPVLAGAAALAAMGAALLPMLLRGRPSEARP